MLFSIIQLLLLMMMIQNFFLLSKAGAAAMWGCVAVGVRGHRAS